MISKQFLACTGHNQGPGSSSNAAICNVRALVSIEANSLAQICGVILTPDFAIDTIQM